MLAFQRYLFEDISDDPFICFGIKAPEPSNLKGLSCPCSAHHARKGGFGAGEINMHSGSWLNSAWGVFANAFKAEAVEMCLDTRSFSLPQTHRLFKIR